MTENEIKDEVLMAYADGQATPDQAAAIEERMLQDPNIVERVAMFSKTATRLSALREAQSVTVPNSLEDRIRTLAANTSNADNTAEVINLRDRHTNRRVPLWQLPLAASIFLALGIAGTLFVKKDQLSTGVHFAGLESVAVQEALGSLPSGQRQYIGDGGSIAAIASFENADGELCREIEYDPPTGKTIVSVACSQDDGWDIRFAVAAAATDATGYAPASSMDTLEAYLVATEAGATLSLEQEALALAKLK